MTDDQAMRAQWNTCWQRIARWCAPTCRRSGPAVPVIAQQVRVTTINVGALAELLGLTLETEQG